MTVKASGEIRVLELTGTPREVGRTHGEAMRDVIVAIMERWKQGLERDSGVPAQRYIDRFLQETDFLPAMRRWSPEMLEEIRGIAEGASVEFDDMYVYQLVDEQWIFTRQLREQASLVGAEHCTAMGVFDPDSGPPILAQNMDIPKFYDGGQVLLRLVDPTSDTETLIFTVAGLIAAMGVSSHGVGVCCNTVSQIASSRDGLPVGCVVRKILRQKTRGDAIAFVQSVRHASGQNYTIGGPDGITSLECSANKVSEFRPSPHRVFHTNHPLVNDEAEVYATSTPTTIPDPIVGRQPTNSETRFNAVANILGDSKSRLTVDTVKAILSDESTLVCAMRESSVPSFTAASMVAVLSRSPVIELAPGPPAVTEFKTHTFRVPRPAE